MRPTKILSNQQFHFLTFIGDVPIKGNRQSRFRCVCGEEKILQTWAVVSGGTKSCGCKSRELLRSAKTIHGGVGTPTYRIWVGMKNRCNNPKTSDYRYYGGRGIRVCKRWDTSYAAFLEDMGERPSSEHTIERIKNDCGYSPSNCKWATRAEQGSNTSQVRRITYKGVTKSLSQWSRDLGIHIMTLHQRLARGWSVERAFTTKPLKGFTPFRKDPHNPKHFKNAG